MYNMADGIVLLCPSCGTFNVCLVDTDDVRATRICCICGGEIPGYRSE
jgi:transcription elongation factor Elf1